MSTNFYLEMPALALPEGDQLHIGKLTGTRVSLQGHKDVFEKELSSWAQWKNIIRMASTVTDEYGWVVPADDFIAMVEDTSLADRRDQYDWVVAHAVSDTWVAEHLNDCWLDPEGFSFTWAEFF